MDLSIRKKLPHIPESIYPVMTELAIKHEAINLAQGFPSYAVDKELMALVNKYMLGGKNQYAPIMGVPELRRNLAYKIQNYKKGYYYMIVFNGEKETVNELERNFRIDENIIRFLTSKVDSIPSEPTPIMKYKIETIMVFIFLIDKYNLYSEDI